MEKNKVEKIAVAFAADENYIQHLSVAMLSILYNIKADVHIHFVVLGDGLSEESNFGLTQIIQNHDASISFHEVEFNLFDTVMNYNILSYVSRATCGRLFLDDIFEDDKLLYLDCDILVRDDISTLWNIDIEEFYAGCVFDPELQDRKEKLGIAQEASYFNAGVLLLNLNRCRQDNVLRNTLKYMVKNSDKLFFSDQDALNVSMSNNWFPLHPRWNVQSFMFNIFYNGKLRKKYTPEIIEAVKDPAIVHFTTNDKPWYYRCENPYVEEYSKYLDLTPWKNNINSDRTLRAMIRKNRRMFKRRLKSVMPCYRI